MKKLTLDDTLSEIEERWKTKPLDLKEAQPASDTKRPMELIVLLDRIKAKWQGLDDHFDIAADNVALVRALRRAVPAIEPHHFLKRDIILILSAPSNPEGTKSSTAPSVPSPKDSLSPEIVIPALCKAVRRQQAFVDELKEFIRNGHTYGANQFVSEKECLLSSEKGGVL